MKYITSDLLGPGDGSNFGLCNQLFQIAALTSHAKDLGYIATFPQINLPSFGNYTGNILRKVNTQKIDSSNFERVEIPFGYHSLENKPEIIYRGYMQSEKYFLHNREFILDLFECPSEINKYISSKYPFLQKEKTMSIHIRRGDYLNLPNHHPTVKMEYYLRAAEYIQSQDQVDKYVIFSDDIEWCKEVFGSDENIYYIINEPDFIDLFVMSKCTHHIIANSTFSWWGAWLNSSDSKIVTAPATWFGPARSDLNTKDLIPENWVVL